MDETYLRMNPKGLDNLVDFDIPFEIRDGQFVGRVSDRFRGPDEVFFDSDKQGQANDLDLCGNTDWEPLTGYSGQYGYRGACMHSSEFIGGGLARDILNNDGTYCLVAVYSWDTESVPSENGYGAEPDSWAVLKYKGDN